MNDNRIILPRKIYALQGDNNNIEQLNIYFRNVITGYLSDKIIEVKCKYGEQYEGFWRIEIGNFENSKYDVKEPFFELTLRVKDYNFEVIDEASTVIVVVPNDSKKVCRVLAIGDSITRWGKYIEHLTNILPGVTSVGTRTYKDETISREGRGGWSSKSYLYPNYLEYPCDIAFHSPFMFPEGIDGSNFKGNTAFWKNVIYDDIKGYDFDGFQKIATGWNVLDKPLYDRNGYPFNPQKGDVVFDPDKQKGANFYEFNGVEWIELINQPRWELSFSKYMDCYRCAFISNGVFYIPDVISILFGPNDINCFEDTDDFVASISSLVDSIRDYSKDIKIIINMPICGSIKSQLNKPSEYYRRLMQEGGLRILERWDNDASVENNIYIGYMMIGVDPVYGYGVKQEKAFKYSDIMLIKTCDSIHPSVEGHKQMGDLMAGLIQMIRQN